MQYYFRFLIFVSACVATFCWCQIVVVVVVVVVVVAVVDVVVSEDVDDSSQGRMFNEVVVDCWTAWNFRAVFHAE